jgi:2-methylcitrate dehydratase PrpD
MKNDGATRILADFISRTRYEDLPAPVIEKAKQLITDQLGVALAGSTLSWNRKVLEYVQEMGVKGDLTVIGSRYRTSVEYAALINGTFGHGFELDDYCTPCGAHVGCVVIPPALAIAERGRISGREFLTAVALGAEILLRVGFALTVRGISARGFHSTSVYGPFGASAAAAKLLNLDKDRMTYALGIAGSHASGTTEYDQTGGDTKRLHAGMASMAGVRAAILAKNGFTSPPTVLEGKNGILNAFSGSPAPEKLTDGLGSEYCMLKNRIKPYACCGAIIPGVDAMREILKQRAVRPDEVKSITVGMENRALGHVGSVGPEPKDITSAQFSSQFALGLAVAKGRNNFHAYYEAMKGGFSDADVTAVAKKVSLVHDDEAEAIYPTTRLGKVTLETTDGKRYSAKVFHPRGSPENPLSEEEFEEKFYDLAGTVLDSGRARNLLHAIQNLETMTDTSELAEMVTSVS